MATNFLNMIPVDQTTPASPVVPVSGSMAINGTPHVVVDSGNIDVDAIPFASGGTGNTAQAPVGPVTAGVSPGPATQLLPANPNRIGMFIINRGTITNLVGPNSNMTLTNAFSHSPTTGLAFGITGDLCWTGPVYILSSIAAQNFYAIEITRP